MPADSPEPGKTETPLPTAEAEAPAAAEGETVQLLMPEMGESVTEGTVLEWHKNEGDAVEEGETVVEVSTDKVDAEVPAPASGTIAKLFKQPDDTVKVGEALAEISASGAPAKPAPASDGEAPRRGPAAGATATATEHRPWRAGSPPSAASTSPAVKGSGASGRITKADVLDAADGDGDGAAAAPAAEGEAKPLRGPGGNARQGDGREPLDSRPRRRSGRSPSTRSTPSARRSTGCSRSAG